MAITDEKYLKSIKGVMLSTNGDGTEAYFKLVAAELGNEPLTSERLHGLLADAGVCVGLNDGAINQLTANPVFGEPVLIATGGPPAADA
jgi:uncharacterized protein (DUF342 family)